MSSRAIVAPPSCILHFRAEPVFFFCLFWQTLIELSPVLLAPRAISSVENVERTVLILIPPWKVISHLAPNFARVREHNARRTCLPVARLFIFTIVPVERRSSGCSFRRTSHSLSRRHSETLGVDGGVAKSDRIARRRESSGRRKREERERDRGGSRGGRTREGGRYRSLMPILQPVQRGRVFRRARRSADAFCHPFKPAAVINKHYGSVRAATTIAAPDREQIDLSRRNVTGMSPGPFLVYARGSWDKRLARRVYE